MSTPRPLKRLLYGGSFDPVHTGHVTIGREAGRALGADRVCLVPAASSPLKPSTGASAEDRLAMCRLAAQEDPLLEVLDLEVRRPGPSYTFDTLRELLGGPMGRDRWMVLVGQDALVDLPRWRHAKELLTLAPFAVAPRKDAAPPDWDALAGVVGREIAEGLRARFLRIPGSPISSTEVRRRVAEGKSVRCWVPDAVADYIEAKGLYRSAPAPGD